MSSVEQWRYEIEIPYEHSSAGILHSTNQRKLALIVGHSVFLLLLVLGLDIETNIVGLQKRAQTMIQPAVLVIKTTIVHWFLLDNFLLD